MVLILFLGYGCAHGGGSLYTGDEGEKEQG